MYMSLAAAERKAWSRFIFTYEVTPKEPSSANWTPYSEYAAFASTPMLRTPLHYWLTLWLTSHISVLMATAFSKRRHPLRRVDALKVDINSRGSSWCL